MHPWDLSPLGLVKSFGLDILNGQLSGFYLIHTKMTMNITKVWIARVQIKGIWISEGLYCNKSGLYTVVWFIFGLKNSNFQRDLFWVL